MIQKFSSINNFAKDVYSIIFFDTTWNKWNEVFKKQKLGEFINPNTKMAFY